MTLKAVLIKTVLVELQEEGRELREVLEEEEELTDISTVHRWMPEEEKKKRKESCHQTTAVIQHLIRQLHWRS